MRRFLSFCLLLAEAVAAWGYTAKIDGIYYDLNSSNHTATVTYRNQNYVSYSGEVVIPASVEYEGEAYSVTQIGGRAFGNCASLQSVSLPNSITAIHDYAFVGCSNLTEIQIPQGVTAIQTRTFEDCFSLASVKIPEGVTTIGSSAFEYCTSLKTIDLPKSLTSIATLAFFQCQSLTEITIPDGVTNIEDRTFEGCLSLRSVNLSKNIVTIGEQAFYNCNLLLSITLPESVTSIGKYAFFGPTLTVTVLGNEPADLGYGAFATNSVFLVPDVDKYKDVWTEYGFIALLKGATAQVHLEAMSDKSALQQTLGVDSMQKITSLTISGTINGYDIMMMRNQMPNLLDIDLRDAHIVANNHEYTKGYHSKQDTLTAYSFTGTGTHIRKAVLPNSVVWIEQNVFHTAYLQEIVLPENLQVIGDSTFYGYSALHSVTLPETLTAIGKSAFQGTGLLSVVFPANVETIGTKAFAGKIKATGDDTRYYNNAYSNQTTYANDAPRSGGLLQTLTIPKKSKLTTIPQYAFAGNNNLRNVSILGDSITKIQSGAFNSCLLDTLVLPPHLKELDILSFGYCTGLKFVAMPNTLTEIAANAFVGCTNLDNVQFPKKLTKIGHHAFADCTNLRNVDIPGLVTNIEDYAFKDCQVKSVYSYLFDPFKIGQNTFSPYANANAILYVPNVEDTEMKYLYDTQWSQFIHRKRMDKDFAYDDFYGTGDITIRCEDDPLKGNPNAMLYPGAGLTVEEGVCDTTGIGNIVIGSDGDEAWGAVIAGCNLRVDSLIQNITIMGKKWYFLGFPFEVRIDDIYANAKYVIYEYDGQIRADRDTTGWKRVPKDQEYLYPGHGYIFQFNFATSGDISIVVPSPDFCSLIEQIILKFFPSDKANNKSWNYASNPFLGYYNIEDLNTTAPITIWDVATSNYRTVRPGDDEYYFSPYEGFFLQNAEEKDTKLAFDRSKAMTKQQMTEQHQQQRRQVAGRTPEQDKERAIINLILASETASDNTRIVINDGAGLGYDLGADAAKFLTTDNGVPQIFSYDNENIEYAINERPMGTGTIELGVRLPKAGMYTISTARMDTAFYLLDRDQDRLHDFADGDYIFSAGAGMHTSRFALVRSRIPQDIDNATNDVRVEPAENGLYIQGNKPITIYNAAGMLVASGIENGLLPLPAGVYMVVAGSNAEKYIVK